MNIRTRFAPSPTGFMHVGAVRTALFAWAYARTNNGTFILRIEDTDKSREVEGSIDHIVESLDWLGLTPDEGPVIGGDYGPYVQSERLAIYKAYAQKLVDAGLAYVDPYTQDEMQAFRMQAQAEKRPFLYRVHRPESVDTPDDWYGNASLRFKISRIGESVWHDAVRGKLTAGEDALDDFVIMKADGYPTYNFAHIVDDFEMQISHVIRGEEFIASVPRFLQLYEALEVAVPTFVTVPPILNAHGGKKLSKRDGAKDVLEYRADGYLPAAVINFLASLGWNDGTEQEIFQVEEIIAKFQLERIQKAGAKFDDQRLIWISGHHIRNMSLDALYDSIDETFWPDSAHTAEQDYKKSVLALVQERLKFFSELAGLTSFFFSDPEIPSEGLHIKGLQNDQVKPFIEAIINELERNSFTESDLESALRDLVDQLDTQVGILFRLIRQAVTGSDVAPGLFETLHVLGKEVSVRRMRNVLQ